MSASPTVRLIFPARADYLLLARLALAGLARGLPLDEAEVADLKLAVTEACGNAVRHAYESGDGLVDVQYVLDANSLVMVVADSGTGIAELEPGPGDLEHEPLEGGMGMAIIRAVVDEVRHGRAHDEVPRAGRRDRLSVEAGFKL
jgi:serine/threonine-protein kinase RsbW